MQDALRLLGDGGEIEGGDVSTPRGELVREITG